MMHLQFLFIDFEVKHKEEVERPESLTIGIPVQRDQPVMPDEVPVESGSVRRQKNEIEMKYGSSPRHSKLSPDHGLCPPPTSPADAARLTPTLEKYCAKDILALTEEVPEGFLDEDGEDVQECDRWKNDLSEPYQDLSESQFKQQSITSDAGSQFQRSFSYRENSQQKQSKISPFIGRSASFHSRWLSDVAKKDNFVAVASSPSTVSKTSTLSFASFSSTEVCRRLLKEKKKQNEHASTDKLCDASNESEQIKRADPGDDKDARVLVSNVLNTTQFPSHYVPAEVSANLTVSNQTESFSVVGDSDGKYYLHPIGNQCLKTNVTKSEVLPVVTQDQQTMPASAFVSKVASQKSLSYSAKTRLSVESPAFSVYMSNKEKRPSSLAGTESSDCTQPLARNVSSEDVSSCIKGDSIQESNLKVLNVVNSSRSQSAQQPTQVDASSVASESANQSVQPLPLGQLTEASSVTQFVASQPQSNDTEQFHKKRFSFNDKYKSFIDADSGKVCRSQSMRGKTSSFLRRTTGDSEPVEAQKVKKSHGKSHPLSKLSSEYLSRDCSKTIKDFPCDHEST